jgi:regulator of replication initiation timing
MIIKEGETSEICALKNGNVELVARVAALEAEVSKTNKVLAKIIARMDVLITENKFLKEEKGMLFAVIIPNKNKPLT